MPPDITIPPEALEAGARAICARYCFDADHLAPKLRLDGGIDHVPYWKVYEDTARACFLAMVKAWPGMETSKPDPWSFPDRLILPLTEKTDGA